jgi:glycosyltransferase involved in cell wall biosynthesis
MGFRLSRLLLFIFGWFVFSSLVLIGWIARETQTQSSSSRILDHSKRILLVVESLGHDHVPRHHFITNVATVLAQKSHAVRVLPVEECVTEAIAERLANAGVSVLACPCSSARPPVSLTSQEMLCCSFCGLQRVQCVQNSDPVLRYPAIGKPIASPMEKRILSIQPNSLDVVIIMHGGGMERTLPHHLSWHLLRLFRSWPNSPAVVFLADDILSLRHEMFASEELIPWESTEYWEKAATVGKVSDSIARKLEAALLKEADYVWTVADRDSKLLSLIGIPRSTSIRFVPFSLPTSKAPSSFPDATAVGLPFHQRKHIVFSGWAWTESSALGLRFFLQRVFFRVLETVPDTHLLIVGHAWESEQERYNRTLKGPALKSLQNVRWLGPKSNEQYQKILSEARLFVSPVIAQTGVASKIWNALSHGVPVITTESGLGGALLDPQNPLIEVHNIPDAFARAVVRLYQDYELWTAVSVASVAFMQQTFSLEALANDLNNALSLLPISKEHRNPKQLPISAEVSFTSCLSFPALGFPLFF